MPPLEGLDISQRSVSLDVADPHETTVVFIFSPECGACKRNWKNWDSLLASHADGLWKPVFVNIGQPTSQEFRIYHNLQNLSLIDQASKNSVLSYRMYFTPETLVVNRDGVITGAWTGVLTDQSIKDFLHDVKTTN
jgi:hypothetical protein